MALSKFLNPKVEELFKCSNTPSTTGLRCPTATDSFALPNLLDSPLFWHEVTNSMKCVIPV